MYPDRAITNKVGSLGWQGEAYSTVVDCKVLCDSTPNCVVFNWCGGPNRCYLLTVRPCDPGSSSCLPGQVYNGCQIWMSDPDPGSPPPPSPSPPPPSPSPPPPSPSPPPPPINCPALVLNNDGDPLQRRCGSTDPSKSMCRNCCSFSGYCGVGEAYCGQGNQLAFSAQMLVAQEYADMNAIDMLCPLNPSPPPSPPPPQLPPPVPPPSRSRHTTIRCSNCPDVDSRRLAELPKTTVQEWARAVTQGPLISTSTWSAKLATSGDGRAKIGICPDETAGPSASCVWSVESVEHTPEVAQWAVTASGQTRDASRRLDEAVPLEEHIFFVPK